MTRLIETHRGSKVDGMLEVHAIGGAGPGGAPLAYGISPLPGDGSEIVYLKFHSGNPDEVGVTGVTNESLLAVLIDRLRGFQAGPFSCRENSIALTKLEEALLWLQCRTRERRERGVEGTQVR